MASDGHQQTSYKICATGILLLFTNNVRAVIEENVNNNAWQKWQQYDTQIEVINLLILSTPNRHQ